MFVTNWISPTKIQKISEITNFFRHYFLSRTEVINRKEEEKKERLDDTSDGGDTCFLKKSYARAGRKNFSNQPPARLRERFFKKMLSSVSLCHSGTSRLSTISILPRPRKQVT